MEGALVLQTLISFVFAPPSKSFCEKNHISTLPIFRLMRRTSDTHPPTATATTMQRWCRALFCCICFSQHVNFNFVAANVDVHWFRDHPAATPTTTTTTRGAASRLLGSSQITPQIVGGTDAAERRFPYYVAMYRQDNSFICGGSLIAPDVVLTAAHCNV